MFPDREQLSSKLLSYNGEQSSPRVLESESLGDPTRALDADTSRNNLSLWHGTGTRLLLTIIVCRMRKTAQLYDYRFIRLMEPIHSNY